MRIHIDSSFLEFSEELKSKIAQVQTEKLTARAMESKLRHLRKDAFLVASQSFPDEVKELLNAHALIRKYSELGQKIDALLRDQNITYNAFDEMCVLQIITPKDVLHEQYLNSEILASEYFGLTSDLAHYDLLIGFCEEPKVNEVLQLTFYLMSGVTVD